MTRFIRSIISFLSGLIGLSGAFVFGAGFGIFLIYRLWGPQAVAALAVFFGFCGFFIGLFLSHSAWPVFGRTLRTSSLTLIILAVLQYFLLPGLYAHAKATMETFNIHQQEAADIESMPKEVPCLPPWTIGGAGKERNRYWWSDERCFDRPGMGRMPVTEEIGALLFHTQQAKIRMASATPVPTSSPTPIPSPTPTAVPTEPPVIRTAPVTIVRIL